MRIKIIYYKSKYVIEPYDENIERCIKKFCDIIKVDRQNLSFYYKGSKIDTKKNSKEFKSKLMILSAPGSPPAACFPKTTGAFRQYSRHTADIFSPYP